MDDDFSVVTDEDIKKQKKKLKGKNRHNTKDTNKFHIMNLNKYDIILNDDVTLSNSAYNGLREHQRKYKRNQQGKGKYNK